MATLRIKIEGEPGAVTLRAFLAIVENAFGMLRDYDVAISREPKASLEWLITNLSTGSLRVAAESRSLVEDRNFGPEVVEHFVRGWRLIEREGTTPPFLSERGMERARSIVKLIGREGTTGLEISSVSDRTEISVRSAANIDGLLKAQYRSIGSIEGRIETLSIHGKPRFIVYLSRTRKAVTCKVDENRLREMVLNTGVLGHRVSVFGVVYSNARGEPLRIDAERIRMLRPDSELPARQSLRGSDPDFTGEMSTDEYIRSVRSG